MPKTQGAAVMSEAEEQAAVVQYLELKGIPFYHVPNERKCSPQAGARLKAQGVRPGVPDLCIPVPSGKYHALYIEMKAKGGRITEHQRKWIEVLRHYGNFAAVCYGADNAMALIDAYMGGRVEIVTDSEK